MPELPEVETIKRDLEKLVLTAKITDVIINNPKVIKEPSVLIFKRSMKYSKIISLIRRGKLLVFELKTAKAEVKYFTVHLCMTGQLIYGAQHEKARVSFALPNRKFLNYCDQRILGELRLVNDWQELNIIKTMGPEPLGKDFDLAGFYQQIKISKTKIKALLLDQTFVAGIGNIYACEALFLAGIKPERRADTLKKTEIYRLFIVIQEVLKQAIKCRGTSFSDYRDGMGKKGNYLKQVCVYGKAGEPCRECGNLIQRSVIAGRGTFSCSKCQK